MKHVYFLLAVLLFANTLFAQSNTFPPNGAAGIGTTTPNKSSLLEVKSTTKGILIPRMTSTQKNAIASPATGLLIYQTNSSAGFYYYNGTAWTAVSSKGANTSLSNLTATTAVNEDLLPAINDSLNLGNNFFRWKDIYVQGNAYINDLTVGDGGSIVGTALGRDALSVNTGDFNTGIGADALTYNTTGTYNAAVGAYALLNNTTADGNTASGAIALYANTTGNNNTAHGSSALFSNKTGSNNTALGQSALYKTTTSDFNTAIGYNAGASYDNGYNNVFVGANTNVNGAGYFNVIAIGQATVCTASSQVTMGNSATNSYRAFANWSNISDGRYKKNVKENVPGLAFINKLRPVTYNLDATALDNFFHKNIPSKDSISTKAKAINDKALKEKEQIRYTGFVAQEVEKAANDLGYDFSGVDKAKDANDVYGLRYAEFVVPLVKAVQELSGQNDSLKSEIANLKSENETLEQRIAKLEALMKVQSASVSSVALQQNIPNP
ncbi:MAG TPA: tail fiber domain-containing protein, partial [Parafilimonas sp.]